jgi:hypothetical protein
MTALPIRLRPDERRDLAKRLAERLGTKTTSAMSIVTTDVPDLPPGVKRYAIEGGAGDVKVKGIQEIDPADSTAGAGAVYQRDTIGIGGLEGGAGVAIEVGELRPSDMSPARTSLRFKEGTTQVHRTLGVNESFRFVGEKFAAGMLKKESVVKSLPLGPVKPEEQAKWLRGAWLPLEGVLVADPVPRHLESLAMIEGPGGAAGGRMIVREAAGLDRAVALIALVAPGLLLGGFEIENGSSSKVIEKALAALAWSARGETASDPRPKPIAWEDEGNGGLETPGFILGTPAKAVGELREASHGHGLRLAALTANLTGRDGKPLGTLVEHHLYGLPEGGFALIGSSLNEGRTGVTIAAPKAQLPRWLDKLKNALGTPLHETSRRLRQSR